MDLWYEDFVQQPYVRITSTPKPLTRTLPQLATDVNHSDILNAFRGYQARRVQRSSHLNVGRQELLYGSQRLISAGFDWANTQRAFDGGKIFWHGDSWDGGTHSLAGCANPDRLD